MTDIHTTPRELLGRFEGQGADKLRGGYYTSPAVANWLCEWAIRSAGDRVLEPACGDGVFLEPVLERLATLGACSPDMASNNLTGVEVIPEEADRARKRLSQQFGPEVGDVVLTGDFFDEWRGLNMRGFDAVVGNPPFIRYQNFPEPCRSRAMAIMTELGLKPNRLTNMWVPFVVAASASLRPGGRLALVLPAELLQVSYAAQLRSFLADRFSRIDIITCNELFFDKAEQEVLLLLADGALPGPSYDNRCRVAVTEANTVSEVIGRPPGVVIAESSPKTIRHDSEKWLKYFLTNEEISLMRELREAPEITNLSTFASVDVGVVTGKNSFFVLSGTEIAERGLEAYGVPIVSRTNQLKGARVGREDWQSLVDDGKRVHLLHLSPLNGDPPQGSLKRYIRMGEEQRIHEGYKCSIRSPWYAVPSVWQPSGFLFRQIYDFPKAVLNQANATSTDTIHRLSCKVQPEQVIANAYTYLSAASAEIEGRSYGGGVLELEPSEAERLLMPIPLGQGLSIEECDALIRSGRLADLLDENSRLVLVDTIGLSERDCGMLRSIWLKMRTRRSSRRRRRRTTSEGARA